MRTLAFPCDRHRSVAAPFERLSKPREVWVALDERSEEPFAKLGHGPAPLVAFPQQAQHVVERIGDGFRTHQITARRREPNEDQTSMEDFEE